MTATQPALADAVGGRASGAWADAIMAPIYAEGDRFSRYFTLFHFVVGLCLAPFYDTWFMALAVGALAAGMFLVCAWLVPGTLLTRCMAGVSLQAFVALHIYQLHGLPEMHFFFFSAFTMLIAYQDWRAPWPGALLIIAQHIWFAVLENSGVDMNFFQSPVTFWQLFFHFGIAILHVAVCSHWATRLRRNTLREAWDQHELDIARARAEAGAAAKSRFVACMSHEIRTPMNGVLGMLTLLEHSRLDEEQQEFLHIARRSGQALLGVIDDILDFSKIEAGRLHAEPLPFHLRGLLDDVHGLLLPHAREKGLAFMLDTPADLPAWVVGDAGRIRQILLNLVGNALKFTAEGEVRVTAAVATASDERVSLCLVVRDTGIGMAPDALRRLFQEFTQADSTTTRRFGGTGLGLAISQRLATLMGGAITVESQTARGTAFTLTLPVRIGAPPAVPAAEYHATGDDRTVAARVLLVEDHPVNELVARRILEKCGCEVTVAHNGIEAIARTTERTYDLVLMDCHMPLMDGFEATRRIRAAEAAGQRMPIVALTASVLDADRQECLASGMDGVLAKPIAQADLARLVQSTHPPTGARAVADASRGAQPAA